MPNKFLTNESLCTFVEGLNISSEQKSFLLEKIPQLEEEERKSLFTLLKEIYLLDWEEKKAIERAKKHWGG